MPRWLWGEEPVKSMKISSPRTASFVLMKIGSSKPSLQVSPSHSPSSNSAMAARTAFSERPMISSATGSKLSRPNSSMVSMSARPPASLQADWA